ncbi:MAG: ABC transporter permease [Holophagales bacterium]|jgi:ABC-type transport system involved in multi-copper enzyme maturation permease subunit|nr:ABC transporter permease [Holophagales bacterium]
MILHVAKKEVLEHIKSFRFSLAFLFIVLTFFVMLFMRHVDYRAKFDDYQLRVRAQELSLDKFAHYNRINGLIIPILPPAPMEIIVEPAVTSSVMESGRSLDDNPFDATKIPLDMIAIVGLLGSLLALLLSYDSINREIHEGTIRLLLSSGVPRIKIIIGKILGGSLAAVLPVTVIFLLASLWLAITGGLGWGVNLWISFMGIFLVSLIYIVFFYCLGAFLSSVILDQTLSALSCFGIWVVFVIVVPVISPYIAGAAIKVPDSGQMQRQIDHIYNVERDDAIRKIIMPLIAQGLSFEDAWDKTNAAELNRTFQDRVDALQKEFRNASIRQSKLSIHLACVSPYSLYLASVEELSGLGFERFQHIENVISNWGQNAREYVEHQHNEARRRDTAYTIDSKLDVPDMPRFQYVELGLSYKYSNALPYILLLLSFFIIPLFLYLNAFITKKALLRLSFVLIFVCAFDYNLLSGGGNYCKPLRSVCSLHLQSLAGFRNLLIVGELRQNLLQSGAACHSVDLQNQRFCKSTG